MKVIKKLSFLILASVSAAVIFSLANPEKAEAACDFDGNERFYSGGYNCSQSVGTSVIRVYYKLRNFSSNAKLCIQGSQGNACTTVSANPNGRSCGRVSGNGPGTVTIEVRSSATAAFSLTTDPCNPAPPPPPPKQPEGEIDCHSPQTDSIRVDWEHDDADDVGIWRSASGGSKQLWKSPHISDRGSSINTSLTPDTSYTYYLMANNGSTELDRDTCRTLKPPPARPFLTADFGDVHAGGGIGFEITCAKPSGGGTILGEGSRGSYVVSAGGQIAGFGSGGSPSGSPLTFPTTSSPTSIYHDVCRPDLVAAARDYIGPPRGPVATSLSGLSGTGERLVHLSGATNYTLPATTINGRRTLFVEGNLTITGPVTYSTSHCTGGSSCRRDQLPSFGVIATGNIIFSSGVTSIDGLYWAGGNIDTCNSGSNITTSACRNRLIVRGMLMARSFIFDRAGTSNTGSTESERIGGSRFALLFLATPPAFTDFISPRATGPLREGERPPLF